MNENVNYFFQFKLFLFTSISNIQLEKIQRVNSPEPQHSLGPPHWIHHRPDQPLPEAVSESLDFLPGGMLRRP
jgi:hypothetical protein